MAPTLVNVAIPVISVSPSRTRRSRPLTYDDGPLPVKPSEHAPRNARIIARVAEPDKVTYTLEIGGVQIDDVHIKEVLDYVSPYDLEQFENQQFEEERELMKFARQQAQLEEYQNRERRKKRAKTKGTVIFEEIDDHEDVEAADVDSDVGRHGRARASYKHFFKQSTAFEPWSLHEQPKRRRRKRDRVTGELMPLSDDDESEHVPRAGKSTRLPSTPATELPKRRRRKRDPVTGELLPLEPIAQQSSSEKVKRSRRRRHPITGELMPLSWRFDPEAEKHRKPGDDAGPSVQHMHRLSISEGHDTKRVKLTSEPSSDDTQWRNRSIGADTSESKLLDVSISPKFSESEDEMEVSEGEGNVVTRSAQLQTLSPNDRRSIPKTSIMSPTMQSTVRPQSKSSSSEKITFESFFRNNKARAISETSEETSSKGEELDALYSASHPKTTTMNPRGAEDSATQVVWDSEEEVAEEEYVVESVRGHALSDPNTTPGRKAVMLYRVKWEGYDRLTWEPEENFVDKSIIKAYRRRAGLDNRQVKQTVFAADGLRAKSSPRLEATPKLKPKPKPATSAKAIVPRIVIDKSEEENSANVSENDDDGYEVEAIRSHHMSDPRSHPGKPSVMLYQVKWVGYKELTWEPCTSFTDSGILESYQRRVGLK